MLCSARICSFVPPATLVRWVLVSPKFGFISILIFISLLGAGFVNGGDRAATVVCWLVVSCVDPCASHGAP